MSLSRNKIKWITSLQIKKFRQNYHKFLVEGDKITRELLMAPHWEVTELFALESWILENQALLRKPGMECTPISGEDLKRISGLMTPNQVLAVVEQNALPLESAVIQKDLSLYLDGIQDPGNLGTILRIADWFGIRHVFLAPNTVEPFNPKVIQASMGAFLRVHVQEMALRDFRTAFPTVEVWGADLQGKSVFSFGKPKTGLLLVIGNEGSGISADYAAMLHGKITIPGASGAGAESLNAAVATGIICAVLRNAV